MKIKIYTNQLEKMGKIHEKTIANKWPVVTKAWVLNLSIRTMQIKLTRWSFIYPSNKKQMFIVTRETDYMEFIYC